MSTFGGLMSEFPDIRVDFFRHIEGVRPPLACFLSHVHSDHLAGLESLKAPFVYCSAATKELLLRLERYPHRVNFELGILESRRQHYRHLKDLLKPIPLETPTRIELAPGNDIQVTLFDANHCTGAVMFLIEGACQAILYTGDIRSEPWFVNNLRRNPLLIEYTAKIKILSCIYLDTSFTEDVVFPTKADGLKELLGKVDKYPPQTNFHFTAWTFGYEEVWIALSRALKSPIHVDTYKMRLYQSLRGKTVEKDSSNGQHLTHESPVLTGCRVGNIDQLGILTSDKTVRLHSCEKGTQCAHLDSKTVWIRPIIARTPGGVEITEMGIGGGGGDLVQSPELVIDSNLINQLMASLAVSDPLVLSDIRKMLFCGLRSGQKLALDQLNPEDEGISLDHLAKLLEQTLAQKRPIRSETTAQNGRNHLPQMITFPYSRHSSYAELRDLVDAFQPRDVYPCTVNESNWHEGCSVKSLFGDLCSGTVFRHDNEMYRKLHCHDMNNTQNTSTTRSSHLTSSPIHSQDPPLQTFRKPETAPGHKRTPQKSGIVGTAVQSEARLDFNHSWSGSPENNHSQIINRTRSDTDTTGQLSTSPRSLSQTLRRKAIWDADEGIRPKRSCVREAEDGSESGPEDPTFISDQNMTGMSYYDAENNVYRCEVCRWEVWTPSGPCSGCGTGDAQYYEITDSEEEDDETDKIVGDNSASRPIVSVYIDEEDFVSEFSTNLAGGYLDDNSSAYDSTSDAREDEYEINSFIDDSAIHESRDDDTESSSSEEPNLKGRFQQMSTAFIQLQKRHDELLDEHDELRRDVFGSDEDENLTNPLIAVIDMEIRDPPISEVIIDEIKGDSQASNVSAQRLVTRAEAFLAATSGGNWNEVSLMSTGDNHTEIEEEL